MYCSKCGNLLNNGDAFCSKCGTSQQQISVTQTPNYGLISQGESDLRLLHISYLDRLRTAEYCCMAMKKKLDNINSKISKLGYPRKYQEPVLDVYDSEENSLGIIFSTLGSIFFVLFLLYHITLCFQNYYKNHIPLTVIVIAFTIGFLLWYHDSRSTRKYEIESRQHKYEQDCKNYDSALEKDKLRVVTEKKEIEKLVVIRNNLKVELGKADKIKTALYNVNIIPKQFRDMYSIYYLYDFLSSSNETLGQALMHCDLDKIKSQLNILIKQNNEIYNQLVQLNKNMDDISLQNSKLQQSVQNYFEKTNRSIAEQNQLQQMIHADNEALKSYARTDLYVKFLKN